MSDDWKPGDLAVCVDGPSCGHCGCDGVHVLDGRSLKVSSVAPHWTGAVALRFAEVRDDTDWCACQFRKIRPDEHEPCEEEFSTLIRKKAPSPEERHERILEAIFPDLGAMPSARAATSSRLSRFASSCKHRIAIAGRR